MKKIKNVITFLFFLLFMLFGLWATADAQTNYKQEGNTFSKVKTESEVKSEKTIYLWTDSRGNEYPIYITSNGSCYINRISKKTGNPYRQYLPKEVSEQICKELGREYKAKTKTK